MKFDINKINIPNALKYRAMFIAGGLTHCIFLIVFYFYDIFPMMIVNGVSIAIYVLGSLFSVRKSTGTMKYGWMLAFFGEIVLHGFLCTLLFGWGADFHLYMLIIVPLAIYVLFLSSTIGVFVATVSVMIVVDFAAFILAGVLVNNTEMLPYYPLSYDESTTLSRINIFFSAIILIGFAMLFALEIHMLLRDLNETNHRLEFIANHDQLTGLYNRHSIKPMVGRLEISERPYCVVLGDIDDFKKVNDTYGHDTGDETLRQVADAIKCGISDGDIACRWGGEEMLLVLLGSRAECMQRITAIREDIISRSVKHDSGELGVTITFGFVDYTEAEGLERQVSLADSRLYFGKKNGKNVIVHE